MRIGFTVKVRCVRPRDKAKASSFWSSLRERSALAGVCAYLTGFILPLAWDIPLILLGVCGALAIITAESKQAMWLWPPFTVPIFLFIASIGLSTLFSEDIGRSIRLSASLLPALLLFFLISQHFNGLQHVRLLSLALSMIGLGVATALLLTEWYNYVGKPLEGVIINLGIPILVVPNDVTFLVVITPLSLALFFIKPRSVIGVIALISILLSIGAICAFRSRTAALTLIISTACAVALMQTKQRWVYSVIGGISFFLLVFIIDGLLDFQLISKIVRKTTELSRINYWSTAWKMFLEAPVFGKGPHTFGLFHKTPWAHNLYLEVLAEQGIVGLGVLIGLLASGVRVGWRIYRNAVGEIRFFSAGALAAFIGFCSAGVFELSFVRQWVVIVLFMLMGIIAQLSLSQTRAGG